MSNLQRVGTNLTNMFKAPEPKVDQAAQDALDANNRALDALEKKVNEPVAPIPQADDESVRRASRDATKASQTSGRQSTFLTKSRFGDYAPAETRTGIGSTILTA